MIIKLNTNLFTIHPDKRFCSKYNLPKGTWVDIWSKYKLSGFTEKEVCHYYRFKTKTNHSNKAIRRWLWRTEVYSIARPAVEKGALAINSTAFGKHEDRLIKELTKNIKSSVHKNPKILI